MPHAGGLAELSWSSPLLPRCRRGPPEKGRIIAATCAASFVFSCGNFWIFLATEAGASVASFTFGRQHSLLFQGAISGRQAVLKG